MHSTWQNFNHTTLPPIPLSLPHLIPIYYLHLLLLLLCSFFFSLYFLTSFSWTLTWKSELLVAPITLPSTLRMVRGMSPFMRSFLSCLDEGRGETPAAIHSSSPTQPYTCTYDNSSVCMYVYRRSPPLPPLPPPPLFFVPPLSVVLLL